MRRFITALSLVTLGATTLAAQDAASEGAPAEKSALAARVLGIVPGGGHMYAGETRRGFAFLGGTVGLLLLGTTALLAECIGEVGGYGERCDSSNTDDVFAAAVVGLWGWSLYDAGRAAQRTNAKRRLLRVSMGLAPVTHSGLSRRLDGTAVTLTFSITAR